MLENVPLNHNNKINNLSLSNEIVPESKTGNIEFTRYSR